MFKISSSAPNQFLFPFLLVPLSSYHNNLNWNVGIVCLRLPSCDHFSSTNALQSSATPGIQTLAYCSSLLAGLRACSCSSFCPHPQDCAQSSSCSTTLASSSAQKASESLQIKSSVLSLVTRVHLFLGPIFPCSSKYISIWILCSFPKTALPLLSSCLDSFCFFLLLEFDCHLSHEALLSSLLSRAFSSFDLQDPLSCHFFSRTFVIAKGIQHWESSENGKTINPYSYFDKLISHLAIFSSSGDLHAFLQNCNHSRHTILICFHFHPTFPLSFHSLSKVVGV